MTTPPLLPEGFTRVLVTGGAGFIGGALVRRLLTGSAATVFNLESSATPATAPASSRFSTPSVLPLKGPTAAVISS